MAIEFTCPACGGTLRVTAAAGSVVRCGGCMSTLRVPEGADSTSADPDPQPSSPPRSDPLPVVPPADEPRRSLLDTEDSEPIRTRKPRGVLFWLVLVAGVGTAGLCACCFGLAVLMPSPNWQQHSSEPGGFAVEFPTEPRPDVSAPGIKANADTKVLGAKFWGRGDVYAVGYHEVPPPGHRLADDPYLAVQVKLIESNSGVRRILRNEPITVTGFPAREVEFLATNGGIYVLRLVITDTRAYRLVAGGKSVQSGDANVRYFLDSFAITDPKLLAAGKERAAQRRRKELAPVLAAARLVAMTAYRSADSERTRIMALARQLAELRSAGTRVAELVLTMVREINTLQVAPAPREKNPFPDAMNP